MQWSLDWKILRWYVVLFSIWPFNMFQILIAVFFQRFILHAMHRSVFIIYILYIKTKIFKAVRKKIFKIFVLPLSKTIQKDRHNHTKNTPRFIGVFSVCSDGTYVSEGKCIKCQGVCKNHAPCNKSAGTCDNGCSDHWTGKFCEGNVKVLSMWKFHPRNKSFIWIYMKQEF